MLLMENLLQPAGLILSGNAGARESRLRQASSRGLERRRMEATVSGKPEPVIQV